MSVPQHFTQTMALECPIPPSSYRPYFVAYLTPTHAARASSLCAPCDTIDQDWGYAQKRRIFSLEWRRTIRPFSPTFRRPRSEMLERKMCVGPLRPFVSRDACFHVGRRQCLLPERRASVFFVMLPPCLTQNSRGVNRVAASFNPRLFCRKTKWKCGCSHLLIPMLYCLATLFSLLFAKRHEFCPPNSL